MFENDVNMYGTQAQDFPLRLSDQFENDVNMYGTQAVTRKDSTDICLRMM